MSGKAAKGKGKSRGGGPGAQRRSRSRNTTPASGSAFSSADTHLSADSSPVKIDYEDLLDKFSIGDLSSFPTSTNLIDLKADLQALHNSAKHSSRDLDKYLRETSVGVEQRKEEVQQRAKIELEQQQEKSRKAAEDAELLKDKTKIKKKRDRTEHGDHKRPPVTGSHQATGQGPVNDIVAKGNKRKLKDKAQTKRESVSPAQSSDTEHQPPPAPPHVFFEIPTDNPDNYRIPEPDQIAQMSVEEKKRTFSVARFPSDDLSSKIPGDPPDEDFSKSKPSNQVTINTFNSYIEPYFRPYSEEDLAFLRERGDRVTPFLMPNLGTHYSELWAEEEGPNFASPAPPTNSSTNKNNIGPKGKPDDISDDQLDKEEISAGPLLSRVLAAMMPEEPEDGEDGDALPNGDSTPKQPATALPLPEKDGYRLPIVKSDYATMEERIRMEMVHVGLLNPDDNPDFSRKEDDEVCARLRNLQAQLREQAAINGARKARIMERLKEQMAYQEYVTILEDLDKQVEQAYSKRSRNIKATKKKKPVAVGVGVAQARVGIGEQARMLMERRKRWISSIEPVFEKDPTSLPTESIFNDMDDLITREKAGSVLEDDA